MKLKIKWIKIISISLLLLLLFIIIGSRIFAVLFLNEPFLGDSITGIFVPDEPKKQLDQNNQYLLKSLIKPIKYDNQGEVFTQFSFLNDKVKDVEVFGLGESSHGVKEFFELKSDFFKYLVLNQEVKLFGLEANFASCYYINTYIDNGQGNSKEALLKNEYWILKNQEILNLVEWMRNYNSTQSNDKKIKFYCYDMQSATSSIEWIENYLKKTNLDFDKNIIIEKFDKNSDNIKNLSKNNLETIKKDGLKKLDILEKYILDNEQRLKEYNISDYNFAKQVIEVLRQRLNYITIENFDQAFAYRDESMANNIKWIRDSNNNSKIMIWAHNGHIGRGSFSNDFSKGNWMGVFLKNIYGDKYFNIGFTFREGAFVARSPKSTNIFYLMYSFVKSIFQQEPWIINENYVKPYDKSYLNEEFSKLETPIFFLEFKELKAYPELQEFIDKEYLYYEIGAIYINEKSVLISRNLYKLFDAIIYVNKTTASNNFKIGESE